MTQFIGFANQKKVILPRQGMHWKASLMRVNGPRGKISRHPGIAVASKAGHIFAKSRPVDRAEPIAGLRPQNPAFEKQRLRAN